MMLSTNSVISPNRNIIGLALVVMIQVEEIGTDYQKVKKQYVKKCFDFCTTCTHTQYYNIYLD